MGFAICISLIGLVAAMQRHSNRSHEELLQLEQELSAPHRRHMIAGSEARKQTLENYMDTQYTGTMRVGGKSLKVLFDTGSFELYVFSSECGVCGRRAHLYDFGSGKASRHRGKPPTGIASFGSGTIFATEAVDEVQIEAMVNPRQSFWAVTDADMDILEEDTFQALLGLGPPSSALTFAEADAALVHDEFKQLLHRRDYLTREEIELVARYDGSLKHARRSIPIVKSFSINTFSACFLKPSRSAGYQIWRDDAFLKQPSKFVHVPVTGEDYWSATMTDLSIGSRRDLGCTKTGCSAVLDTGTTLISAPPQAVRTIYSIVDAWVAKGGTCDDLSQLPDLEFNLGGTRLSLPPESYVGNMEGSVPASLRAFMPRRGLASSWSGRDFGGCTQLIMEIDVKTESGPLWILGMPFFRNYYISFYFKSDRAFMPVAKSMSFSIADENCDPGSSPESLFSVDKLLRVPRPGPRPAHLRVNASRIRPPRIRLFTRTSQ
jgi:hypothetical protein